MLFNKGLLLSTTDETNLLLFYNNYFFPFANLAHNAQELNIYDEAMSYMCACLLTVQWRSTQLNVLFKVIILDFVELLFLLNCKANRKEAQLHENKFSTLQLQAADQSRLTDRFLSRLIT